MKRLLVLWHVLDIPSGAILGVYTGAVLVMSLVQFFSRDHFVVPGALLTGYATAVTGVTASKFIKGGGKDETAV